MASQSPRIPFHLICSDYDRGSLWATKRATALLFLPAGLAVNTLTSFQLLVTQPSSLASGHPLGARSQAPGMWQRACLSTQLRVPSSLGLHSLAFLPWPCWPPSPALSGHGEEERPCFNSFTPHPAQASWSGLVVSTRNNSTVAEVHS